MSSFTDDIEIGDVVGKLYRANVKDSVIKQLTEDDYLYY